MICEVVRRLAAGDYRLEHGVAGVEPVSAETAKHLRDYVADFGATLVELPSETWETSVAQWIDPAWEILVDLWTAEDGRSDMVLSGRVVDSDDGARLTIHMIYVP